MTAAQDQARQHLVATQGSYRDLQHQIDTLAREVDTVVANFHDQLDKIRAQLTGEDTGASLGRDGVGGDSLRAYEYGLLLNSQRTANRVIALARAEAERILTTADTEVAELEQRIQRLRKVEGELRDKVSERLRSDGV